MSYGELLDKFWKDEEDAIYNRVSFHFSKIRSTILKTIGQTKIISLDAVIQDIVSGGTETINIDAILAILGVTTTNIDSILIKILINFKLSDRNRITSFSKNRSRSFKITDRR